METTFVPSQVLVQVYAEVQQRFSGIDDLAHGWEHVSRVYQLALHIAAQENGDRFIVGMAALLHDFGRTVPAQSVSNDTCATHHADLSISLANDLLARYHVPDTQSEAIRHAIIAHSFSKGIEPRTLEAGIVRDADRLDGLGAIGILRWAITGTIRSSARTLCYHPTDPFALEHQPDDKVYMLDHFYSKLLKLAETMTTQTGRKLAQQRTDFMRQYLDAFRQELAWT